MTLESENKLLRREREPNVEAREGREVDEELKVAAAMERAELLANEVKSSKKQMQNILMHMTQVKQAIKQLRAQLQITATDDPASVAQDQEAVDKLKKQIAEYLEEIVQMKDELISEQTQMLAEKDVVGADANDMAKRMVEDMIRELGE